MVIPTKNKFKHDQGNQVYIKQVVVNGETYTISVPETEWNVYSRKKINNLLKNEDVLNMSLPYGAKLVKVSDVEMSDIICPFCKCEFSRIDSRNRHMEVCKSKNAQNIRIYDSSTNDSSTNDSSTNDSSTNDSSTNDSSTNDNSNHNNDSSSNHHNKTTNITMNNCKINPFGEESMDWLTETLIKRLFTMTSKLDALETYISSKHFNEHYPENQNIRIYKSKDREKFIQAYSKKGKWSLKKTKEIIELLGNEFESFMVNTLLDGAFLDSYDQIRRSIIEQYRQTRSYENSRIHTNEIWGNMTNLITVLGEEKVKEILVFLLERKKMEEEQD
jgi:hypothetical protein